MSYVQTVFQLAKFPLFILTPKCRNFEVAHNIEIGGAGDPARLSRPRLLWFNLRNFFRQQYHFQGFGIVFKAFTRTHISSGRWQANGLLPGPSDAANKGASRPRPRGPRAGH